jgi:hypothetical protein
MARPKHPEIESGAVDTEMREDGPAEFDAMVRGMAAQLPTEADLTGAELSEIRLRSEITDRAQREAQEARDVATHKAQLAQFAQEALTARIGAIVTAKGVDPAYQYRIDVGRGVVAAVPRQGGLAAVR